MIADEHGSDVNFELNTNLHNVKKKIQNALNRCGDPHRQVTLVAVSKKQPIDKIQGLMHAGQTDFGESYVQEAIPKIEQLAEPSVLWHFIGSLQTKKARNIAGRFKLIHSVDSLKLAQGLHKKAKSLDLIQPVLIQVNIANEKQKSGVPLEELPGLAGEILTMKHLRLDGLMLMPPFFDDPEKARPYFSGLRRCRDQLQQELKVTLPHLSMGMSGDFEVAVEEGATLVRVGTALFGARMDC
ncbi:MAG: YggS family pyridoxal phosphate-dependent enzyme [Desulfovibrionales bacterium]|nr:YggS family pyridoxal phosphate-dependent enzyme [Desulfovibrionales bacterium]